MSNQKDLGSNNTYLDPTDRSFETVVFKRGKPVSHAELNLIQDIQGEYNAESLRRLMPSGFLGGDFLSDTYDDYEFGLDANTFEIVGLPEAHVNGWILPLEFTNTDQEGRNQIVLEEPPTGIGDVSVDFVYLEVWRSLLEASPSQNNRPAFIRIVGAENETFDLNTQTFEFTIDQGTETTVSVTFSANSMTASDVVTEINTAISATALSQGHPQDGFDAEAFEDNGKVGLRSNDLLRIGSASANATLGFAQGLVGNVFPHGNTQADESTWLNDDMLEPPVQEDIDPDTTTRRVQVQYAFRNTRLNALSRDGYSSTNVFAQGPNASETTLSFTESDRDPGLWVAGDGDVTNDLNTVDGYLYSIPVALVWRRNSAAWDYENNGVGGGLISGGTSGRPDGLFSDQIVFDDLYDLRNAVVPKIPDWQRILEKNTSLLLDNALRTWNMATDTPVEWEVATSTTFGNRFLKADAFVPNNNSTNKGNEVRHFDGICKVFSDRSHVQNHVIEYDISEAIGATWAEDDQVTFVLPDVDYFNTTTSNQNEAFITDVKVIHLNDNGGGSSALPEMPIKAIVGLGTDEVTITLDTPPLSSSEDIWVEYEITYQSGGGLTSLVADDLDGFNNFILETGTEPVNYGQTHLAYEDGPHREVEIEWTPATDRTVNTFIRPSLDQVLLPEIPFISDPQDPNSSFTVSVSTNPATVLDVEGRVVTLDSSYTEGDPVEITFTPVRAFPETSEMFVYYLAPAVQTVPSTLLPATLDIEPVFIPSSLYSSTMSSGSVETPYPYEAPLNQVPVNESDPDYRGEFSLGGPGPISITSFESDAGFLKLPVVVPMVDVDTLTLSVSDKNIEELSHYKEVEGSGGNYFPSVFAQNLSSGSASHKTFIPMIAKLKEDTDFGKEGAFVLVILSQYFDQSPENKITFGDNDSVCAAIYRLKGNWLTHSN